MLPIGAAAVRASQNPGTEIDGTEVGGAKRGVGGRWVTLMRRRLLPTGDAETPHQVPGEHQVPGHQDAPVEGSTEAS